MKLNERIKKALAKRFPGRKDGIPNYYAAAQLCHEATRQSLMNWAKDEQKEESMKVSNLKEIARITHEPIESFFDDLLQPKFEHQNNNLVCELDKPAYIKKHIREKSDELIDKIIRLQRENKISVEILDDISAYISVKIRE